MKEIRLSNAFGSLDKIQEINDFKFELDNDLLKIHIYKKDDYFDCIDIDFKMDNFYFKSFCKEYAIKNK